jgi:CRISPR-associated protein Cmr1
LGYGVFCITEMNGDPGTFQWKVQSDTPIDALPDMRTFTFFRLRFTPRETDWWTQVGGIRTLRNQRDKWNILERLAGQGMVPVMPALKNALRFGQEWSSMSLKHWLFGTLRGDTRVRSKVSLSWAYRLENGTEWESRGWVYLPQDATGRAARSEITRTLERALDRPPDWFRAMRVGTGHRYPARVTFEPQPTPWQLHTTEQVTEFARKATK